MLTIVAGGVLMGAALAQMASPAMQFAAQPEWRNRLQPDFSANPLQFVDSGPRDLSPFGWTPGLTPQNIGMNIVTAEPALAQPVDHAPDIDQALDEASAAADALDDPAVPIAPPQPAISGSLPIAASNSSVPDDSSLQ